MSQPQIPLTADSIDATWLNQAFDGTVATVAEVRAHMDDDVAALMVTNPNTLGLFEAEIAEICAVVGPPSCPPSPRA